MARFGTGQFGTAKFGVEEISEAQLSLVDTLKKSFARSLADSITLSDALRNALSKAVSEFLTLREEQNITEHIGPWSESFEECTPGRWTSGTSIGANWVASPGSGGVCEILTDGGKFGSNYARITDDPTHSWKAFVGSGKAFTLEKGKWYRASVHARSSAVRGSYAYLFYAYGESRLYKSVSWGATELGPDKGWVRKEIRFQVPDDAAVTSGYPYLYGHLNHNNTVSEVDYDGYRLEGPFDSDPGPIIDSPILAVGMQKGEAIALADTAWQGFSASLTDALTLSESIARLVAAVRGDSATLSDLVTASAQKALSDAMNLAETYAAGTILSKSDVLTLAEGFSVAVAKALAEILALADAISSATGVPWNDVMTLADQVALLVARGQDQEAVSLLDDFLRHYVPGALDYLFKEDFWALGADWVKHYGSGTAAIVDEPSGNDGKVLHANGYVWYGHGKNIPYDPSLLYEIRARIRQVQEPTTGGKAFYVGVEGVAADGTTFINASGANSWSSQHYFGAAGHTQTVADGWKEWKGYFKGHGTPAGGYHPDPNNPGKMYPGVAYIRPLFILNYSGGDGVAEIDYEVLAYSLPITDEIAKLSHISRADLLALTESLMAAASKSLSDALSIADAFVNAAVKVTADSASSADSLQTSTGKVLSDVAFLADAIRSAIEAYPGRSSVFGLARFGHESFDNQQPGEAVSLRDAIASKIGFGVLTEDLEILADAIRSAVERLAAENPELLDSIASGLVAQKPDEAATASDAVTLQVARAIESLLDVSDVLLSLAAEKGFSDMVTPMVDSLTSAAAKVVGLALALGDQAAVQVAKALGNEAVALVDAIAQTAGVQLEDVGLNLSSVLQSADVTVAIGGARFGRSTFGAVTFGDEGTRAATTDDLAKAISAILSDAVSHLDALVLQAIKVAASAMTLAEAVTLAAQKVAGDPVNVVDLNAFAVSKSLGLSVAVADDIAKAVAVALQGLSMTTSDQVQAALAMLRQVQDEMATVDGVVKAITLLRDEVLALSDEDRKNIEAKRAETIAIASALGKDVAAFPQGDVTGLLDEAQLLGAWLAGDLMAPLYDSVTGEVYTVLSQVFIEGISVVTQGLTLKESVASRVGECSFTIPDPTPQVIALYKQGADVHVYLSDSGENIVWGGRIVSASVVSVSSLVREVRVTAQDYATRSQSVLVSGAWMNTKYTDIVRALWQQYAPEDNLVLDVTDNPKVAAKWVVKWESLAEATGKIALVLGWTWRVDWDGGKKIFRFFDPGAEMHPRALSVANLNIESGTAEFGQDEEIVNSVYVLGGQTLYQPDPYRRVADGQETYFVLPQHPYEPISVKVNGVEKVWGYETTYWPEGKDCLINPEGHYVRFQTAPASGAVIEVTYQTMRPVRVHLEEPGSIALYGQHDQVVNDSKIADPLQARETARKTLREKAWPKQYGRMNVYEPGLRAGKLVHVYLPDRNIDGLYQVSEISWMVNRASVDRSVSLNRVADAGASIAQVIKTLAERVAALEAGADSDNATIDRFIDQTQKLKLVASAEWLGDIRPEALLSSVPPIDGHVRSWRAGTTIKTWADVSKTELVDSRSLTVQSLKLDVAGLSGYVKVSTARFGFSRFGEARAGTEVRG